MPSSSDSRQRKLKGGRRLIGVVLGGTVLIVMLCLTFRAFARDSKADYPSMAQADAPRRSPAADPLDKLGKLQGHWTYDGQFYETAARHAGPSRGAMDCDVLPNKGYISCDILSSIPDAQTGIRANYLSLFSYSPSEKSYMHFVITNDISPLGERLVIDGDKWVSNSRLSENGKTILLRDLFVFLSSDKLDQTSQFSVDNGQTWVTRWHAIAAKTGA